MAIDFKRFVRGITLKPQSGDQTSEAGDLQTRESDGKMLFNDGSTASPIVTEAQTATLTNKTLDNAILNDPTINGGSIDPDAIDIDDNDFTLRDNGDPTKELQFNASGITAGQTRILSAPDANATIVGTDTTQTLTNKTIDADANTISNIENADIKTGAAIDRAKLANGTNYRILANSSSGVMSENAALTAAGVIIADANGQLASETTLAKVRGGSAQDNSSITFPASGVLTTNAGVQALTNKTFSDPATFAEIATPATPSSGFTKLYAKADGNIYQLTDTGAESAVGGAVSATLTNTHIYVGNGSNVATDVALSGDATLANTGAITIANNAITSAKILNDAVITSKILNANVTGAKIEASPNITTALTVNSRYATLMCAANTTNARFVRGTVNGSQAKTGGEGFTVVSGGTGIATITWSETYGSAPVIVVGTAQGGGSYRAYPSASSTSGATINVIDSGGSPFNGPFNFIALG